MPHIPLPQLVFLCVTAAAFLTFMTILIYVSVWAMVAENTSPKIATDVTPAHRASTFQSDPNLANTKSRDAP